MSGIKHARGKGTRLNDAQRLQIIDIIDRPNPPSMRSIARQFDVTEKAIHKIKLPKMK